MKEGTKAEDTKPKHTDDHTDNPHMNTLTNTLTNRMTNALTITEEHTDRHTCEDAVGEVEPVEGGHEGGGHKAAANEQPSGEDDGTTRVTHTEGVTHRACNTQCHMSVTVSYVSVSVNDFRGTLKSLFTGPVTPSAIRQCQCHTSVSVSTTSEVHWGHYSHGL